jgi:hypothetical protein
MNIVNDAHSEQSLTVTRADVNPFESTLVAVQAADLTLNNFAHVNSVPVWLI